MKNFLGLLLLSLVCFSLPSAAQIQLSLNIRTPAPPNFSTWVNDPSVAQIIVVNASSQPLNNVAISFKVNDIDRNETVANSKDGNPSVPRFNVPAGATVTLFGRNVFSEAGTTYNQALLQSAITSNSFPEGSYEFCIRLINTTGQELASAPCRSFIILNPDPPTLISPSNSEQISPQLLPLFRWTIVQNLGATLQAAQITYTLRVAPIFTGQTSRVALETNPLLINQSGITTTSFQMLPSSPQFSLYPQAVGWVWQVQALNSDGTPAARNEGRSEIYAFRRRVLPPPVQLLSPASNEQIDGNKPVLFKWMLSGLSQNRNSPPINCSIKISPINVGQTPEIALLQNSPLFQIGNLKATDSLLLPITSSTTRFFAWQITATDNEDMPATENMGKSQIGGFQLRELPLGPALLTPNNVEFPHDSLPTFKWVWTSKPNGMVYYMLRITPIYRKSISPQGDTTFQSPSEALSQNAPLRLIIDSSTTPMHTFQFQGQAVQTIYNMISSPQISLQQNHSTFLSQVPNAVGFAWDVYAIDASGQSISQRSIPMRFRVSPRPIQLGLTSVGEGFESAFSRLKGRLVYNYANGNPRQSPENDKPLKNQAIKLILVEYDLQASTQFGYAPVPKEFPSVIKLLATAETDANGNFQFDFVGRDSMISYKVQDIGSTKLRVARLIIENKYFVSPNQDLFIQPGQQIDLSLPSGLAPFQNPVGLLRATVKSVQWQYTARTSQGNLNYLPNTPMNNVKVYVFRKPDAPFVNLPLDERRPINTWRTNVGGIDLAIPIDSAITNQLGEASFRLIKNDPNNPKDCYYFYSVCDTTLDLNYRFRSLKVVSDTAVQNNLFISGSSEAYSFSYPSSPIRRVTHFAGPVNPMVIGEVYNAGEGNMNTPVDNAKLTLIKSTSSSIESIAEITTNSLGDFAFSIPDNQVEANAVWTLIISKLGYSSTVITVSNDLRRGLRLNLGRRFINPRATVRGRVIDLETNQVVRSRVSSDSIASVLTNPPAESFEIKIPAGNNKTIRIEPVSPDYFPKVISSNLQSGQTVNLGDVKVVRKAFRVEVTTRGETGIGTNSFLSISGLLVEILPINSNEPIVSGMSDQQGKIKFTFQNGSTSNSLNAQFRIRVSVPVSNQVVSLERKVITTVIWQSESFIPITVNLKRGGIVGGVVRQFSINNALMIPIKDAKVKVVQGGELIEATTNAMGEYRLTNVPTGVAVKIQATLPNSQLLGADTTVFFSNGGAATQTRDFTLQRFTAMDITKLLGFEIETRSIRQNPNGTYLLHGSFTKFRSNSVFKIEELGDLQIPFVTTVVPTSQKNSDGRPYMRPTAASVVTDVNGLSLKIHHPFKGFRALLREGVGTNSFLAIRPDRKNDGSIDSINGMIQGEIELDATSIQSNSISFQTKPYLLQPSGSSIPERRRWTAIKSNLNNVNFASIPVAQFDGRSLPYTIHGFKATADSSFSRLRYDPSSENCYMELRTILQPSLENLGSVSLSIGNIIVRRSGVEDITRFDTLALKLSPTWSIISNQWSLRADNGFRFQKGNLKLGALDIPFVGMHMLPSRLETAAGTRYEFSEMSFVGSIKIRTEQESVAAFGYDSGEQKWAFTIGMQSGNGRAATINALPKMAPSDKISINNLSLFSDGTQQISLDFSSNFTLYSRFAFSPKMLYATGSTLNITGEVDLRIPTLNPQTTRLEYATSGTSQVSNPRVIPFGAVFKPNAVSVTINVSQDPSKWRVDDNGFFAYGTVVEEGVFSPLKMKLVSSALQGVKMELLRQNENGLSANQQFIISKDGVIRLENLSGGMQVQSNVWTKLIFTGKPIGQNGKLEGIEQQALTFVVTGDVELSPNQGLKIKNFSTPLGDLTMIFDHRAGMLHGALSLNNISNPAYDIKGGADLRIDKNGFFVAADALVDLKSVGIGFVSSFVLGKYPNIRSVSEITSHFNPTSYNFTLPPNFVFIPDDYNNLAGFYLIGQVKDFIIPFPDIDLNLSPVVRLSVNLDYGLAIGLGMNFQQGANLVVKGAVFVSVEVSARGSVGLICVGANLGVGQVAYLQGSVTTAPSVSVQAGLELVLYGGFYIGGGCCDSDCGSCDLGLFSLPCLKKTFGPANFRYGIFTLILETNPKRFKLVLNGLPDPIPL